MPASNPSAATAARPWRSSSRVRGSTTITGIGTEAGARADEAPRPDHWSAYDRPELVERLTRAEAGRRTLDHGAARGPALPGLQLARGQGAASAGGGARRERQPRHRARAHGVGSGARPARRPAARARARRPAPASAGRRSRPGRLRSLERRTALKRLAVAGFGMMQVMMFALPMYVGGMEHGMQEFFRLVSMLISVPVALYSGWPFYVGAWHAIRGRTVSMDVPVSLGILGAFVASVWNAMMGRGEVYFDSVTMFVFFLTVGRYVEMVARHRAGSVADALARLAPVTARRLRDGRSEDVQAIELQPGDELLVRTGEVFAADGVVVDDVEGRVDESMLTGESTPIAKGRGSAVHAGTQNLGAPLRVRVVGRRRRHGAGWHRRAARARAGRAAAAREGGGSRGGVVPEPHPGRGGAGVRRAWWVVDPAKAFPAALAVLVVTCPCALSLATPAVLAAATADLARRGVLVTRTDAFEPLARATHVLWDKTGTLTRGLVRVEQVEPLRDESADDCFALAVALEQYVRASDRAGLPRRRHWRGTGRRTSTVTAAGAGPRRPRRGPAAAHRHARIRRRPRAAGSRLAPRAAAPGSLRRAAGCTSVTSTACWPVSGLTDPVRAEAAATVAATRGARPASTIVSGDAAPAVAAVAARTGIERLRGAAVAAGQGRPAAGAAAPGRRSSSPSATASTTRRCCAAADVAVAMGRGSALAQTSADLILVRDSLDQLPGNSAELARRAQTHRPPEPRLVDRLQPRGAAARRARPRAGLARRASACR
jgi:Cu2+-exporting ATPase